MSIKLGTFPLEIFGHPYNDKSEVADSDRKNQYCPFLNRECVKPRKSDPKTKVGVCSLGYNTQDGIVPVIICPQRLLDINVYEGIRRNFYPDWPEENILWVKEVSMPKGGHIDYVAINYDKEKKIINDFFCIEYQTCGTTGSPYQYVVDLLNKGEYDLKAAKATPKNYRYGFNWENEFLKTMMQQVLKKGRIVTNWNRKIVFIIQDVAMDYIQKKVDTSLIRSNKDDPIFFLTFKEIWDDNENKFILTKDKCYSTDINGVKKILEGAAIKDCPTENKFIKNIQKKGKKDNVIE